MILAVEAEVHTVHIEGDECQCQSILVAVLIQYVDFLCCISVHREGIVGRSCALCRYYLAECDFCTAFSSCEYIL